MNRTLIRIKQKLGTLSLRIGLLAGAGCVICYIASFAQMMLPLSLTTKGILWTMFFGLAKTLQYTTLLILGKTGIAYVKNMLKRKRER